MRIVRVIVNMNSLINIRKYISLTNKYTRLINKKSSID